MSSESIPHACLLCQCETAQTERKIMNGNPMVEELPYQECSVLRELLLIWNNEQTRENIHNRYVGLEEHFAATHAEEKCHLDASVCAENYMDILSGKIEYIKKKLSASSKKIVGINRHVLAAIIEVLELCAKQTIPLRGHTEENNNFMAILRTADRNDPILSQHLNAAHYNSKYTSPQLQNELIGICASQVKEILSEACLYFASLVDEATDKSTKEQLSVRFVDGTSIVREEFL